MLNYLKRQWSNKKITITLIVLGFFVGSIILSIGTSITYENYMLVQDQTSGEPTEQLDITIEYNKDINIESIKDVIDKLSKYGEIQLLNLDNVCLNDHNAEYQVVPVSYKQEAEWHIPVVEGRYLKETDKDDKVIVIGREIAEQHGINIDDSITINKDVYTVVGISGRDGRETIWDNVIYVNFEVFVKENVEYFVDGMREGTLFAILKEGKEQFQKKFQPVEYINDVKIEYSDVYIDDNTSSVYNAFFLTLLASGIVFTIAIVNITNLMTYWIMERKTEIGIMKALGANNGFIVKWIVFEIILMSTLGMILALTTQKILVVFLSDFLVENSIYINLSWINLIVSMGVSMISGIIAAIIPVKRILKFNLAEII